MNSKNLRGLREAYSEVYASPELTEEPVWEGVETWVSSLIEEGYDLSDYTWEEMYEAYIEEAPEYSKDNNRVSQFFAQLSKIGSGKPQSPSSMPTNLRGGGTRPATASTATRPGVVPAKPLIKPPAPILPPPSASRPAPARPALTSSRPAPTATPAKPSGGQTGDKAKDMATWASTPANKGLAAASAERARTRGTAQTDNPLMGDMKSRLPAAQLAKPANPQALSSGEVRSRFARASAGTSTGINNTKISGVGATMQKQSFEWGSTSKLVDGIANAYSSIYEAKKVDQDKDGDNDFADVRIARLIASGVSKEEAIRRVKDKSYNEEVDFVNEKYMGFKALKASIAAKGGVRDPGAVAASIGRKKYGKEKFQKAAATDHKLGEDFELWVNELVEEGYDLSDYTWEEMFEIYEETQLDEATRMRKELGKEGETATRKELARRSNAYQRSGSVDRTIAGAERAAGRTTPRNRDESQGDYKTRMQKRSQTLNKLAANRRGSVRSGEGLRGYASKVTGGDKDLQSARSSARSAGTLTPAEKRRLGEDFELWVNELVEEGYDLSDYTWEDMFEIYEETAKEKEERIAARRARLKEIEAQGRVMTSSKRTSQTAAQRRAEKKAEALERAAEAILNQTRGPGRVSDRPMGSQAPAAKEAPPEANRRLKTGLKRDTLGTAADDALKSR